MSRNGFTGERDPHQALTREGAPTCPTNQPKGTSQEKVTGGLPGCVKPRSSPRGSQERKAGARVSTHGGAALRCSAAWTWACRWPSRLQSAGCLDGSWKCRLLLSVSSSSSRCLNASAGNPECEREESRAVTLEMGNPASQNPAPHRVHPNDLT